MMKVSSQEDSELTGKLASSSIISFFGYLTDVYSRAGRSMAFAEEKNPAYDHIDAKKAMVSTFHLSMLE